MDVFPLLAPVITVPVIAALTLTILGQAWDAKRRLQHKLKAQAKLLGKLNAVMTAAIIKAAESEMKRRVDKAISVTVDETLKAAGVSHDEFEYRLRTGGADDIVDRVIFGTGPHPFTMRRARERGNDPFRGFSLHDLAEALGGEHKADPLDHASAIFRPSRRPYNHNEGPLEAAAAEGRTHAYVQDDFGLDGGNTGGADVDAELLKETQAGEGVGGFPLRHSSGMDYPSPRAG